MIMPKGKELLLPVNPHFIWLTIIIALLIKLLPLGQILWLPDILAIVLTFWAIHQPRYIGFTTAFILGLVIDVNQASLLGQHALNYVILIFFTIIMSKRIKSFDLISQAVQLLPIFILVQTIALTIGLINEREFPGWQTFIAPALQAALWTPISYLLLAPQRRPHNPDANKPI